MAGIDLGTLRARITLDDSDATRGLENVSRQSEQLSQNVKALGVGMVAMGTAGIVSLAKLVKAGGEWDAQVAGTDFLMQNLDKSVQKTINSNLQYAKTIGLTTQQYKDGAVELATYFKNMGLTADQMNKMSGEAMTLIADLGAVKDIPFDEALARFKSGLMGNYEALDAFGISISANMLANTEYVKSLGKTWDKLSDNEKMLAVYNEIMRQGAVASGLASQEAQQYSIQMQLLKTNLEETAGTIGRTLLPAITPFINSLNDSVEGIKEWVELNPELTQQLMELAGVLSGFLVLTGNLILAKFALNGIKDFWIPILSALGSAFLKVYDFLKLKFTGQLIASMLNFSMFKEKLAEVLVPLGRLIVNLPLVSTLINGVKTAVGFLVRSFMGLTLGGQIGLVLAALALLAVGFLALNGNLDEVLESVKNFVINGLQYLTENLPQWLETGRQIITSIYNGIIENLPLIVESLTQIIVTGINFITENLPVFVQKGVELISKLAEGIAEAVPTIVIVVTTLLIAFLTTINEHLPQLLEAGIEILTAVLNGIIEMLPQLIDAGLQILTALVGALIDNMPLIIEAIVQLLTALINTIAENLPQIMEAGGTILLSLVEGLVALFPVIVTAIVTLIGVLLRAIISNLPKILQAGGQILKTLCEGIIKVLGYVGDAVIRIIKSFIDSCKKNLDRVMQAGSDMMLALVKGIVSLKGRIEEAGANVVSNLLNGIKKSWSSVSGWVSGSLSSLMGKSRSIDVGVNTQLNDNGISTLAEGLTRDSLGIDPVSFGFTPKASRSLLNLELPITTTTGSSKNSQDSVQPREIVVNSVLEVDGYQLAKSTARQMLDELNTIERRNARLGGVF